MYSKTATTQTKKIQNVRILSFSKIQNMIIYISNELFWAKQSDSNNMQVKLIKNAIKKNLQKKTKKNTKFHYYLHQNQQTKHPTFT